MISPSINFKPTLRCVMGQTSQHQELCSLIFLKSGFFYVPFQIFKFGDKAQGLNCHCPYHVILWTEAKVEHPTSMFLSWFVVHSGIWTNDHLLSSPVFVPTEPTGWQFGYDPKHSISNKSSSRSYLQWHKVWTPCWDPIQIHKSWVNFLYFWCCKHHLTLEHLKDKNS